MAAWNQWLSKRYPDRAALAAAWIVPPDSIEGSISLPGELEFSSRGMYVGHNSLRVYDYFLFAQETFLDWVRAMREKRSEERRVGKERRCKGATYYYKEHSR